MLYLFCSAATRLYKRDALESISYPPGHIFRFRYDSAYVQPEVLNQPTAFEEQDGLLTFVDTVGAKGSMDFDFYPVRKIKTLTVTRLADAIYVAFRLGEFVNYGKDGRRKDDWDRFFKALQERPWPPPSKSGRKAADHGYFIFVTDAASPDLQTESPVPYENWHTVIKQLDASKDLAHSTFYLILGFFRTRRGGWMRRPEIMLDVTDNGVDSIYSIPMGQSVVLKLLLSRPSFDYDDPESARTLKMTVSGDSFAGLSKDKVHSESRYNEDRTIIVCKRVFDSALASMSIEEPEAKEVRSPRVTLLTRVKVPAWVMGTVVGGVAVSTLLLAVDSDSLKVLALFLPVSWKSAIEGNAKGWAAIAKALSPLPVALSAFLAFKRLPIK